MDRFAEQLRAIFGMTATTSVIAAPIAHSELLELIVTTAVHVIHARAGSLLLVDEATQELVFEVATSVTATELRKLRVPLGEGIAGLVALTGEPMAVADAQSDPRHAHEIAEQTGFLPRSLLCVPLQYEDRVIGVIELLDKAGAAGFDAEDMHTLSLFARQAAVAIEQSNARKNLASLLRELLMGLGDVPTVDQQDVLAKLGSFAEDIEADPAFRRSLELARLVHQVAQHGDDESDACLAILRGFTAYLGARQQHTGLTSTR
jgi:GAF domain-containing protein